MSSMNDSLEKYFTEIEREKRIPLYEKILEDPEIEECIKQAVLVLRNLRYEQKFRRLPVKDAFLDVLMEFFMIDNQLRSGWGWKRQQKRMLDMGVKLGLSLYPSLDEAAKEVFQCEYANLIMYFAALGMEDKAYNSGILHLGKLEDEKYAGKLARDLKMMTEKLPEEFGITEYYRPFKDSVARAYMQMYPSDE